jgi:hypothetical protein
MSGDWPRLVNLRRCARAAAFPPQNTDNDTIALYNNSAAAELLLVWNVNGASIEAAVGTSYQQIGPLATQSTTVAVVPGDAPPPGILSTDDIVTLYPPDFYIGIPTAGFGWPATFPFAVLLPGWSLVFQLFGGGAYLGGISLWWEAILPKYFDRIHTPMMIDLAIQQQSE